MKRNKLEFLNDLKDLMITHDMEIRMVFNYYDQQRNYEIQFLLPDCEDVIIDDKCVDSSDIEDLIEKEESLSESLMDDSWVHDPDMECRGRQLLQVTKLRRMRNEIF